MKRLILFLVLLAGCYTARYPVTPLLAEGSTYKLFNADGYQGTAWAVNRRHAVTAGHMCNLIDPDGFVLVTDAGRQVPARKVLSEYGVSDLCVLETRVDLVVGLVLADRAPRVGETVTTVGYPDGKFAVSAGPYLGDTDGPDANADDNTVGAYSDHGASGSAVFTKRGVVGVLVRGRMDGLLGYVFIPVKNIRALLDAAGVKYDVTPDAVPETPPPDNSGVPDIAGMMDSPL